MYLNTRAQKIESLDSSAQDSSNLAHKSALDAPNLAVHTDSKTLYATYVFNATYAGLNTLLHASHLPLLNLKHEIAELALIELPERLERVSFTLMDGPFFSFIPFLPASTPSPSRHATSLSHVRYTPHAYFYDDAEHFKDSTSIMEEYLKKARSNYPLMIRDATRYLPLLGDATYLYSLYTIKTVLMKNEGDDGRPILFSKDYGEELGFHGLCNILGGKIDNIYDILEELGWLKEMLGTRRRRIWDLFL